MDDDLWGPPLVVREDTLRNLTLRRCEFWFDCRTDVLEENIQNAKYCEQVWRILTEKKPDAETIEPEKDSVSPPNDMASSGRSSESLDIIGSSDSDKTVSTIPDGDTSSAKSALDDENTSSISDAQTNQTSDSSNQTGDIDPEETRLKPQENAAKDQQTVEVAEDADTTSGPLVVARKIDEAEEHSSSSLVTDQVVDSVKQAPENKSSSAISSENTEGFTLTPLPLETREKVREKANDTNEDGEILKDQVVDLIKPAPESKYSSAISSENTEGSTLKPLPLEIRDKGREKETASNEDGERLKDQDNLQDIVTASEPFTTEFLLEMCDEQGQGRETIQCDETSQRSNLEAKKKIVVKEELMIMNLLTEVRQKAENDVKSVLIKKRQRKSTTSFIRNTKQKVQGENNLDPGKNTTREIIMGSSVPRQHAVPTMDAIEEIVDVSLIPTSELMKKTGKQLRRIAKRLQITQWYKLKKEDLLQKMLIHLGRS